MRFAVVMLSMQACLPDKYWSEAEHKVTSELAASGFQVDRLDGQKGTEQDLRLSLIRLTKERNAVSAVMILKVPPSLGAGVDIWISDRLTERVIVRHLGLDDVNHADDAALVGLKTVEALQSSYLEIARLAPLDMKAKIPKEIKAIAQADADGESGAGRVAPVRSRSFLGVGMGAGAMGSPKSFGVSVLGELSLEGNPTPYLSLQASVALAGLIRDVAVRNVVSTFQTIPLRGFCLYTPFQHLRLRPVFGIGGGVLLVRSKAVGSYPYRGKTVQSIVGTFSGTAHLVVSLSRHIWLRAGVRIGALFPEITLRFAGYPVGTYGPLVIEGFLHLEARFFWPGSRRPRDLRSNAAAEPKTSK